MRPADGGWRARFHRYSTRLYGPDPAAAWLTWIGNERIAVGVMPTGATIGRLAAEGVTHVVNCRATWETFVSQELAIERGIFGRARVVHAPMLDTGWRQHPRRWSAGARFAARTLDEDPTARVLVHCKAGVHRSVLVAYAALRLRGRSGRGGAAARLSCERRGLARRGRFVRLRLRPGRTPPGARPAA